MDPINHTFNWNQHLTLQPVGYVISDLKTPSLAASKEGIDISGDAEKIRQQVGEIDRMMNPGNQT